MLRWEYKSIKALKTHIGTLTLYEQLVEIGNPDKEQESQKQLKVMLDRRPLRITVRMLNDLCNEGWELVRILPCESDNQYTHEEISSHILRREVV